MLGAPQIIGALSECSRGVEFHKLVPGATVRLQTKAGVQIEQWTVVNADQAFDFTPPHVLKAGADVQAVQFTPGESGLLSALAHVNAHPTPPDLSKGAFAKPLFECGECVWLFGVFPGADLQVLSHGTEVLGKGVVRPDGQIEVDLKKRPLKVGDNITATQTACAVIGGSVTSASPIAGGRPVPLDSLTLPQTQVRPVKKCATTLFFEKVMDGASITVTRTPKGGPTSTVGPRFLPVSPFTLWGFTPFQGDEHLVIETNLQTCKKPVGNKVALKVDPRPPDRPTILNTICTDTPDAELVLGGLELNALVEITVNTPGNPVTLHFGASAPQDNFPLSVGQPGAPTLKAGAVITARQNLCGGPSDWSKKDSTTVIAGAPMVPNPFTPFNHATNVALPVFLHWLDTGSAPCSLASSYDVRVATTMVMALPDLVFAPKNPIAISTVAIPSGILKGATVYFWQVRAYHPGNTVPSNWSAIFQFTTQKLHGDPPPSGDQTFVFCQTCPGFGQPKTISVTAPDFATAEAMAMKNLPSGCFLSPGKCP